MKNVIPPYNKRPIDVVPADECDIYKYYGTVNKTTKERGFIVQQDYRKGPFRILCQESITISNCFVLDGRDEFPTLQAALTALLETKRYEIYEFDCSKELFKWLSE